MDAPALAQLGRRLHALAQFIARHTVQAVRHYFEPGPVYQPRHAKQLGQQPKPWADEWFTNGPLDPEHLSFSAFGDWGTHYLDLTGYPANPAGPDFARQYLNAWVDEHRALDYVDIVSVQ